MSGRAPVELLPRTPAAGRPRGRPANVAHHPRAGVAPAGGSRASSPAHSPETRAAPTAQPPRRAPPATARSNSPDARIRPDQVLEVVLAPAHQERADLQRPAGPGGARASSPRATHQLQHLVPVAPPRQRRRRPPPRASASPRLAGGQEGVGGLLDVALGQQAARRSARAAPAGRRRCRAPAREQELAEARVVASPSGPIAPAGGCRQIAVEHLRRRHRPSSARAGPASPPRGRRCAGRRRAGGPGAREHLGRRGTRRSGSSAPADDPPARGRPEASNDDAGRPPPRGRGDGRPIAPRAARVEQRPAISSSAERQLLARTRARPAGQEVARQVDVDQRRETSTTGIPGAAYRGRRAAPAAPRRGPRRGGGRRSRPSPPAGSSSPRMAAQSSGDEAVLQEPAGALRRLRVDRGDRRREVGQ